MSRPRRNRRRQHLMRFPDDMGDILSGKVTPFREWIDPRTEEYLADINIPEPGHDTLIQQNGFDRGGFLRNGGGKIIRGKIRTERLRPQKGERRPTPLILRSHQVNCAETTRIDEAQLQTIGKMENHMRVAGKRRIRVSENKATGHAKMHDDAVSPIRPHNHVFSAAHQLCHAGTGEACREMRVNHAAQTGARMTSMDWIRDFRTRRAMPRKIVSTSGSSGTF